MKNDRDLILELGFDELSEAEVTDLGVSLAGNESLRAELDAVRAMKADLRSLQSVPECQLSSERLRDAILSTGIKPKHRLKPLWVWATPLAAAALALIAFLRVFGVAEGDSRDFREATNSVNRSAGANITSEPAEGSGPMAFDRASDVNRSNMMVQRDPTEVKSVASATQSGSKRVAASSSTRPRPTVKRTERPHARAPKGNESTPKAASVGPASVPGEPETTAPIIIISADRDAATGANRATEELEDSNVVIGG